MIRKSDIASRKPDRIVIRNSGFVIRKPDHREKIQNVFAQVQSLTIAFYSNHELRVTERQRMDLNRIRIFCEVYRQGGYSVAARKLALTQSAVSQQVRALERELGTLLFDESHRSKPTAAGDYLYREGSLILAAASDLRRGIAEASGVGGGQLRFGMIDVAAIAFMPRVLSRFRKAYPQIKVEAVVKTSGELMSMVEEHALDLAVAVTNRLPEGLEATTIYRDSIVAVVPPGSRLRKRSIGVWDLRGEPLILYPLSSHSRILIEEIFRRSGVIPTVNMEMHYPAAICSLVQQGMGTGLLSELSAEESRLKGQAIVRVREFADARTIGVVTHGRRRLTPQARALAQAIEEAV